MLINIHPETPGRRQVTRVAETIEKGGIVIYPTDTIYGIGCDIRSPRSIEKIARLKGMNPRNPRLSFIFSDISQISKFTRPIENNIFKLLKRNLPGPFTFILNANNQLPKLFKGQKRTIGVRIPDCNIIKEVVSELGSPILNTSIHAEDEMIEYTTDPELIHEKYRSIADMVIDGGTGKDEASTVVDCTSGEPEIVRQGLGILEF